MGTARFFFAGIGAAGDDAALAALARSGVVGGAGGGGGGAALGVAGAAGGGGGGGGGAADGAAAGSGAASRGMASMPPRMIGTVISAEQAGHGNVWPMYSSGNFKCCAQPGQDTLISDMTD